jgi:hypothetical protein
MLRRDEDEDENDLHLITFDPMEPCHRRPRRCLASDVLAAYASPHPSIHSCSNRLPFVPVPRLKEPTARGNVLTFIYKFEVGRGSLRDEMKDLLYENKDERTRYDASA